MPNLRVRETQLAAIILVNYLEEAVTSCDYLSLGITKTEISFGPKGVQDFRCQPSA